MPWLGAIRHLVIKVSYSTLATRIDALEGSSGRSLRGPQLEPALHRLLLLGCCTNAPVYISLLMAPTSPHRSFPLR